MIKSFPFTTEGKNKVSNIDMGKDWPVVYLINDKMRIYVGETSNITKRMTQHLNNSEKNRLEQISIILDKELNKSAALDIEQNLIQLLAADQKYDILNLNSGQSSKHNYFKREMYLNKIESIWNELKDKNLVTNSFTTIKNTDLFKYSPYVSLTSDQNEVTQSVVNDIINNLRENKKGISIINGGAGTGKTVLAINMMFNLLNGMNYNVDLSSDDDDRTLEQETFLKLKKFLSEYGDLKIGFVVPMTSLRETLGKVFKLTGKGLSKNLVIGPSDVVKEEYDILFVDESHRLSQRKNLTGYGSFDATCKKLDLDKYTATHLDWIVKSSKYQVLFYDENQTVKGSDITSLQFNNALRGLNSSEYFLTSQLRCSGGQLYTKYISDILSCNVQEFQNVSNFEFKIFDKVDNMINSIKILDKEHGLCRNVSGYSWEWISKECKTIEEVKRKGLEDIKIDGNKYIWNMENKEWILRESAIDEIGCIHTTQGYDLNYIGVIFGNEIDYNKYTNKIEIDINLFKDTKVKAATDVETVQKYIINSYKVMMMRGIKGCFVYACNKNLREYLKRFIKE